MKRKFPTDFNFVPQTYLLSVDFERFQARREEAEKNHLWIMKPCAEGNISLLHKLACGRGIKMISKNSKIKKNKNYLVQEYLFNPHLLNGLKYDLRVYVLVSSYNPLRVYIYKDGLTRYHFFKKKLDLQLSSIQRA